MQRPAVLRQKQGALQGLRSVAQLAKLAGHLGLVAQGRKLALNLGDNVVDSGEIRLRRFELPDRLPLADAIFLDTGGLFHKRAAILRLHGEHGVDLALPDDGVGITSHAGIEKQLVDIAQAAGNLVDQIVALAGSVEAARDRDLVEIERERARLVVESERGLGKAERAPAMGAREDHVLGGETAQRAHALLAQDPLDRVCNVTLAAAVGAHHRGDSRKELQLRPVREGLEPEQLKPFEVHSY